MMFSQILTTTISVKYYLIYWFLNLFKISNKQECIYWLFLFLMNHRKNDYNFSYFIDSYEKLIGNVTMGIVSQSYIYAIFFIIYKLYLLFYCLLNIVYYIKKDRLECTLFGKLTIFSGTSYSFSNVLRVAFESKF